MSVVRTYNPSVRVGNWNEDVQLQEDTLKDFLERKSKGQLLLQRTQNLASQPARVSCSRDGMVHYGDRVMLVNKPASADSGRGECTLSLNLTAENLLSADPSSVPPGLSGSPGMAPTSRNLLVVVSPLGTPDGEPLRYNEPFYLCMPTEDGYLYLKSDVASFQNTSKKARHNKLTLVDRPSFCTQFEVSFFDPRLRIEFEHHPVPANQRVIVTHQKTNQAIAVEAAHRLRTAFGWESEVSCHTYYDSHKAEEDTNHWMFMMEVPGDPSGPSSSAPGSR